ncbi:interferon-inducible double-stranded RNA-dependent protein kinase activator A homolog isoform X2 [Zootermopsis nevadensis]|nr:interferon-inducible double-stranded RNA-dependent protein kinase activator A homolog isoform X2 [Zootermopsis nevadensis]XP_021919666.1 interferon-inducible double-stranded RNA-dependent protein kinase activator A homolog isoform X2 [Zootermopsis nevadensis]
MGSKTPVSILQEMCIRNGNLPQYELIHDGGGSHEALFKYRVLVGETTAIGSGRSKKEAKHDAAKCILKRLNEVETSSPEPIPSEMIDVSYVTSPYVGKLQENAVGALQELCMTNDIQVPVYKVIGDEGPPHAKQFTVMCQVSKLEESAVARTKKQAKQQAAFKMLNRLKRSLADVLTLTVNEKGNVLSEKEEDRDVNVEIAVSKYNMYKEMGISAVNTHKKPIGQKISGYHTMLKSLDSVLLNRLREGEENLTKEAAEDPIGVLKMVLEELNLDAEINGVEATTSNRHATLLSISTSPESVLFGVASTVDEAYNLAASSALEHLKLMTA